MIEKRKIPTDTVMIIQGPSSNDASDMSRRNLPQLDFQPSNYQQ